MSHPWRRVLAAFCGSLSVAALLLGATYTYVSRSFFNADVFATRVADGLTQPDLARVVAGQLTDQIISAERNLLPYRPVIMGSVERVVQSAPFRAVVRKAVKQSHETILSEAGKNLSLTVSDAGIVVRNALSANPELADKLPAKAVAFLEDEHSWPTGKPLAKVMHIASRVRTRALVLLSIALVAAAAGLASARHRDRYLLRCGLATAFCAVVIGGVVRFGGPAFASLAGNDFMSELVRALWPAFVGPLAVRMWVLAGMGLVLAAGVTSTFQRVDLVAISVWLRRAVGGRTRRGGRGLLRAAVMVTLSGLAVFHPTTAIQVLVVTTAVVLFFFGIQELFTVIVGWLPRAESVVSGAARGRPILRIAVVVVLGAALAGAGAMWYLRQDRAPLVAQVVGVCNGHPELCGRALNEVAFATSHNSMSGGDIADWMFPNQEKGIPAQLEDGVRGFLIDIHYGIPVGDRVKTLLEDEEAARAKYEQAMGKEAVDAAMRIRDRLVGEPTGERDVYLAHGFCELGATRFVDALEKITEFLVMNPGEVVVIIIQDEGVTPQDVAACFERSGLDRLVYRGPVTRPWPTLGKMIADDQRVVVMAENNAEGVPWYHLVTEICQETPYGFKDPSEFSNRPNRGGKQGSLLLMNHWIETTPTPLPSNAEIVNAYHVLLRRARQCRKERGMIPNLVAVDFYRTGALIRVVDALNGVEESQEAAAR